MSGVFTHPRPIAEIVDAEINAHLSSAHKRTAELSLVRVVLAACNPKENSITIEVNPVARSRLKTGLERPAFVSELAGRPESHSFGVAMKPADPRNSKSINSPSESRRSQ